MTKRSDKDTNAAPIFEFVRKDYGDKRAPWHIGFDSVYPHGETWTLCGADFYGYADDAPDLPEGGRLCAKCARELQRRTRGAVVRK